VAVALHSVVIPVFHRMQPTDLTGPHNVFMTATMHLSRPGAPALGYALSLVSPTPGTITAGGG